MLRPTALLLISLAAVSTALLLFAGCKAKPAGTPSVIPAVTLTPLNGYAGNAACAECHAAEYRSFTASEHNRTLRLTTHAELGDQLPQTGPIPGTDYSVIEAEGRLALLSKPSGVKIPLDLAFGSGKNGISFVALRGEGEFERVRLSWFPAGHEWRVTPGMEHIEAGSPRAMVNGQPARDCILCHAVTVPVQSLKLEDRYRNVGCETCHGPSADHIKAARTPPSQRQYGPNDLRVRKAVGLQGADVSDMCRPCHSATRNDIGPMMETGLLKFQVISLSKSRCFIESAGKLTCVTCHNPHEGAPVGLQSFEAACLKCHVPAQSAHPSNNTVAGKPCPTNATTDCIKCHMPARRIFPNSNVDSTMADHWIRVYRKGSGSSSRTER